MLRFQQKEKEKRKYVNEQGYFGYYVTVNGGGHKFLKVSKLIYY